jgi:hypothetical protein
MLYCLDLLSLSGWLRRKQTLLCGNTLSHISSVAGYGEEYWKLSTLARVGRETQTGCDSVHPAARGDDRSNWFIKYEYSTLTSLGEQQHPKDG